MVPQVSTQWCWAAVGVACANYYRPWESWGLCRMATETMRLEFPSNPECCNSSGQPDGDCAITRYFLIDYDRPQYGSFVRARIDNGATNIPISYDEIKYQIRNSRLIAVRYRLGYLGHFAVVYGFDDVDQSVYLQSPKPDEPYQGIHNVKLSYTDFLDWKPDLIFGTISHSFYTIRKNVLSQDEFQTATAS